MLYFGYGSNLNAADLFLSANLVLKPVCKALVCDHRLAFNYRSGTRQGGALSMVVAVGHVVEGVLFDIEDDDSWATLDAKEGARSGCYTRKTVTAFVDGRAFEAVTYVTSRDAEEPFVRPHPRYVDVVAEAYAIHGIDPAPMLAAALGHESPRRVSALFVYGTLLRDQRLHPLLKAAGQPRLASTQGRLVDLGMFPALLEGEGRVHGECYLLDDLGAELGDIDRVEGFTGEYNAISLYHRVPARVEANGTSVLAWTYRLAERSPHGTPIPHGCWRCYNQEACEEAHHDR